MPIKIFCCYAHEDEQLLNKLKAHLRPMQRQGLIDIWHDRDISAGTEWEQEISKQLNEAGVILLLVSPDFMSSDYCYGSEMKRALERNERGEARVIPIILRHVYWQDILGNILALPTDGKPVMSSFWHNPDEAFFNVAQGIRQVVEGLTFGHAEAKSPGEVPLSLLLERDPLYAFPKPKRVRLFIQPRGNNTLAECAGACAISADETRFALCDGISASVLPRPWAALLARQWIKEPCYQFNLDSLYSWLEEPRKLWQDWVYRVWLPRANVSQEVAFNLVQQGAASTLLGVDLDEKTQSWKATAIGDTCLFILRNFNRQWHVESFPLTLLNDFKYAPSSITSRMSPRSPLLPNFRYQSGKYSQGDILMMATDALASWLFRQIERKVINWEDLIWLTDQGHFADFVDEQRRSGQLVDDDIMLIISSL